MLDVGGDDNHGVCNSGYLVITPLTSKSRLSVIPLFKGMYQHIFPVERVFKDRAQGVCVSHMEM